VIENHRQTASRCFRWHPRGPVGASASQPAAYIVSELVAYSPLRYPDDTRGGQCKIKGKRVTIEQKGSSISMTNICSLVLVTYQRR